MKLVVGLGNIGEKYTKTRHNVGFMTVDAFASNSSATWQEKPKLKGLVSKVDNLILLKPTTMMNLSGQAVRATIDYYKIASQDILVISDDIDRTFGEARIRQGGGDGGHNGLKSVINHVGSDFWRLRVGIANEHREQMEVADFVLSRFSAEELKSIQKLTPKLTEQLDLFAENNLESDSFSL